MEDSLLFFKQYCIVVGKTKNYAFAKISDGNLSIVFLDGSTSDKIGKTKNSAIGNGILYEIGKNLNRIDFDIHGEIDFENFKYNLTHKEYLKITSLCKKAKEHYTIRLKEYIGEGSLKLLETFINKLGENFDDLESVSPISIWETFAVHDGMAQVSSNGVFQLFEMPVFESIQQNWYKTKDSGVNMGEDFVYWFATEIMNVKYLTNPKDYSKPHPTFKGMEYWKILEKAMEDAILIVSENKEK